MFLFRLLHDTNIYEKIVTSSKYLDKCLSAKKKLDLSLTANKNLHVCRRIFNAFGNWLNPW